MNIAVYPGSFDPITFGHIDIVNRALKIFDKVIIVISVNHLKNTMFSEEERVEIISEVFTDNPKVEVVSYKGLTIDACKKYGANTIIRGLRMLSDFEYEYSMSLTNKVLDESIETVFYMTSLDYTYLSSTTVKEVNKFDGDITKFLPESVINKMNKKN